MTPALLLVLGTAVALRARSRGRTDARGRRAARAGCRAGRVGGGLPVRAAPGGARRRADRRRADRRQPVDAVADEPGAVAVAAPLAVRAAPLEHQRRGARRLVLERSRDARRRRAGAAARRWPARGSSGAGTRSPPPRWPGSGSPSCRPRGWRRCCTRAPSATSSSRSSARRCLCGRALRGAAAAACAPRLARRARAAGGRRPLAAHASRASPTGARRWHCSGATSPATPATARAASTWSWRSLAGRRAAAKRQVDVLASAATRPRRAGHSYALDASLLEADRAW